MSQGAWTPGQGTSATLYAPDGDGDGHGGGAVPAFAIEPDGGVIEIASTVGSGRPAAQACLEQVRDDLGASRAALMKFDHGNGDFVIVAVAGCPFLAPGVTVPIWASTAAKAASEGKEGDFTAGKKLGAIEQMAEAVGLRAGVTVPLWHDHRVLGALAVSWDRERPKVENATKVVGESEAQLVFALLAPSTGESHVLVCHEHVLVAGGLARELELRLDLSAEIATTEAAIREAIDERAPDLIVASDALCDDGPGGLAGRLRDAGIRAPLLVLARADTPRGFESALRAGATGYLPLGDAPLRLPEVAAGVLEGRTMLFLRRDQPGHSSDGLTAREREVLLACDQGLSDKQIANDLQIAVSTVKGHTRAIYAKLGAVSRTEALHKARRAGII
jgi:DNA-binding NarL/FixJ family response regulator